MASLTETRLAWPSREVKSHQLVVEPKLLVLVSSVVSLGTFRHISFVVCLGGALLDEISHPSFPHFPLACPPTPTEFAKWEQRHGQLMADQTTKTA